MNIDFSINVTDSTGEEKNSDAVYKVLPSVLESYQGYESGDMGVVWDLSRQLRTSEDGEIEINDTEKEILERYIEEMQIRLDLKMTVLDLLD